MKALPFTQDSRSLPLSRRLTCLAVAFCSTLACETHESTSFRQTVEEVISEEDAAEALLRAEHDARREAYENHGIVPAVPAELSSDPTDPEFVFRGYAKKARPDEIEAVQREALTVRSDREEPEDPDSEDEVSFGVFVSHFGEIWEWIPQDPEATMEAMREAAGVDPRALFSEPHNPDGTEVDESDEGDYRSLIYGDSRSIRSRSAKHKLTAYPLRAFGALNEDGRPLDKPNAMCTATKIGPRHLLTAAHCVNVGGKGAGDGWVDVDWWPGQDGMYKYTDQGSPAPNGYRNVVHYWAPNGWLNDKKWTRDYAVLILNDTNANCNLGWLGVEVDYSLAATGHWHWGYPGWGNTCQKSNHPNKSCYQSMWGENRNITRTTTNYAFHTHDSQGGHSGGPLYETKSGGRFVHAVHSGCYTAVEGRAVKINSGKFSSIVNVLGAWKSNKC